MCKILFLALLPFFQIELSVKRDLFFQRENASDSMNCLKMYLVP